MDKNKAHQELFKLSKSAFFPDKNVHTIQQEVNTFWNSAKKESGFEERVKIKLQELQILSKEKEQKSVAYWVKVISGKDV